MAPYSKLTWDPWRNGVEYELEAKRTLWDWTVGVALDMGPVDEPTLALGAFIGDGWQRGRLRLDATAGLGLELTDRQLATQTSVVDSTNGTSTVARIHLRRTTGRGYARSGRSA